ncbi:response regulator [Ulvibacter sp.]|nr:response regulator [Ulvibacter sp.]
MKILVVEDDMVARAGIKRILSSADIPLDILLAENGKEGVDYFSDSQNLDVDFVLLDLNMPVMNGFEFLEAIRKNNLLKDLPVVVHSTSGNPQDLKRCRELGISGYFVKHIDYSIFKGNLTTIINYWNESKQKKPYAIMPH